MKRFLLLLGYALLATNMIYASTITFNSSNNTFTENGHNFTVSGEGYVWNTDYRSASYCAINNTSSGSTIVTKTSGNSFQLNNLWIKGAWNGFQLVIYGYNGSSQLYSTGTISVSAGYAQTNLSNWTGVNKIIVTAVSNGYFAIDDIDYTVENATPTDIALSNSRVADGAGSGTTVGTFSTTDPEDAGGHTYTFASGGTDNSSFSISGTTLLTSFVADAATKSSYAIKIRSTDTGSLYFEKDFTVTVTPTGTVWTGAKTTFTKADYADFTLEANQDRITTNVWITRQSSQGIFNIKTESGYVNTSPDDTEWATGTTANYLDYTYTDWETWQRTETSYNTPGIVGVDAVIHLISENIYIDIKFTAWTSGASGGGFAYERSTPPPVPVELTEFKATVTDGDVVLNWQTATEVNNYGFSLERKSGIENREWEEIGFVNGHGNSNSPKEYSFVDVDNFSGKIQYRLKQIDTDGQFDYSPVVEVTIEEQTDFAVKQNFPNPFNPSTQIEFNIPNNSNVEVKVFNVLGMEVATLLNEHRQAGVHKVEFDASNLSSGIYFYRVVSGKNSMIRKMVLLR